MNNISKLLITGAVMVALTGCDDNWLKPKPLSFYAPENMLVDADGMRAALGVCEKELKLSFMAMDRQSLLNIYFQRLLLKVLLIKRVLPKI